jgi:nitrogen fixation NifU-like protein
MSDFYRELILDHYKSPRSHGELEGATTHAEGQNPLCGDEVTVYLRLAEDGETIEDVSFTGTGCAISQASTSMLTEVIKGRKAAEIAALASDEAPLVELMDESGTPLTPVRLKCALLGLQVLKLALHKGAGTPLPEEWAGSDEIDLA